MVIVVCSAFISTKEGVLLVKEAKAVAKGEFGLPGGKLESDEDLESCAVRECQEETGFDIMIDRLLMVSQKPRTHEGNTVIKFIYSAHIEPNRTQANAELGYVFVNKQRFDNLIEQDNIRGKDVSWLLDTYFSEGLPDTVIVKKFA